jgi:hypothetical protein
MVVRLPSPFLYVPLTTTPAGEAMKTTDCLTCDRRPHRVSARGMCEMCEAEFISAMALVKCANRSQECTTPASCLMQKKCVQIRAAVRIVADTL